MIPGSGRSAGEGIGLSLPAELIRILGWQEKIKAQSKEALVKHGDIPAQVARLGRWGWAALRNGGTQDSNAIRFLVSRLLFPPCACSIFFRLTFP